MSNFKPKVSLVAGGAGLIGSHLCERLLALGHEVICLDNFSTGSAENIRHLSSRENFRLVTHDVTLPVELEADHVFNLACPASPIHYQADPIATAMTSVLGTRNMLELAARCNGTMLQASTSEVYGDPAVHPQPEDYRGNVNPIGPRSCYDEGKRCAETLCSDYRRTRGVKAKIARIFNTYGPRMHPQDGRVIANFVLQALRNEPITIYGDGGQTRSFCYVHDLVAGLIALIEAEGEFWGPVNLGNPEEISILELAKKIVALTNSRSRFEIRALPHDDPARRCPDIGLAKRELGWAPSVSLEQGLLRTIRYFDDQLSRDGRAAVGEA